MKKLKATFFCSFFLWALSPLRAQELFNYTEPASNMPARSIGIRLTNNILDEQHLKQTTYQLLPELMWGVNNRLMLHFEGIASNSGNPFTLVGTSLYAKYRLFSRDKVHQHFRMAAFSRISYNKSHIHYQEIETNGMNTGFEFGGIATQLLHKQAFSTMLSYEQITDNGNGNEIHSGNARNALNYTLSAGRLVLPKKYTSYQQTNFNLMIEILGQVQPQQGLHYIDIAPSMQFIIRSQTRIDIGYRKQLTGTISRMATNSLMLRVEHLLFNVL
jgi:hypothetical protein